MTEYHIPISSQALTVTRWGEPDFDRPYNPIHQNVRWRYHNDPEYHALIYRTATVLGVEIEELLELHSDRLPYERTGLPSQYARMYRGGGLPSLHSFEVMLRDTYAPALAAELNRQSPLLELLRSELRAPLTRRQKVRRWLRRKLHRG